MEVIAGVDCHKDTHTIAFLDSVGKLLSTFVIPTNDEGYQDAIQAAGHLGNVIWGLEGTGSYGAAFASALHAAALPVYEVPGVFTKRHRRHASHRGKSDANDACAIAETVLRERERLPRYAPSTTREALRLQYEQRDRLIVQRSMAKNRLHSLVLRLELKLVPRDLRSERALRRIEEQATGIRPTDPVIRVLLSDLHYTIEDIRSVNARVKDIEKHLVKLVRGQASELLDIHGVSAIVAAGLIGHAGSLRNCRDASAFAMRCGTAPIPCSSGRNSAVRLSLGGNRQLNRLLHVIALSQVRTVGHLGRIYYDRKRSEGKSHRAAFRALKRQLTTVVFFRLTLCDQRINKAALLDAA